MMSDIAPQTANGGLNEQMQQMVKRQRTCLAAAVGPDGMLDGSLLFGAEGFIGSPAPDRCSFSLNAIQEGSRLRAWLRIGRRTGTPVPWTMFFTPQKREGALLIQGQARLVQDEPSGDQPVGGLRVEVTIARALSPLGDSPGGLLAGGEDTTPHAADRA
ncbi:MAG TPA: hypothetical protein VF221_10955, partial [Chloroflexota bacterium]